MKEPARFVLARQGKALVFLPMEGHAELFASLGQEKVTKIKQGVEAALAKAKGPLVLQEHWDMFDGGSSFPLPKHKTPLGVVAEQVYFALKRYCPHGSFRLIVTDTLDVEEVGCDWDGHIAAAFETVAAREKS